MASRVKPADAARAANGWYRNNGWPYPPAHTHADSTAFRERQAARARRRKAAPAKAAT
jgi:hypothetical protein